ncbi:TIGR01777 family protein [Solimonas sp. K1W22B-7]|uniref:TIGR01777 family oxidoreductase n=1 Tax=Solimonas sp. K1W22B-7 TaxID=2303331 RepID=UPI000E33538C|nr:TIGR01777 family oxidoreductase [Solimonas sp. K1W22B-7]AXQ31413.1 TIGR01777 family protein [Solimonas sp. K1W22B-7]
MHVLVTGGTGFIGRPLCAALLGRDYEVTVLTRNGGKARDLPFGTRVAMKMDGIGGYDALINLAGENLAEHRWNEERLQQFTDSRVQVTRRMVDHLRNTEDRPRVIVSGSAIGWYGARGDEALSEHSTSGGYDEFQSQLCRAWEAEARKAEKLGVRVCLLRTGLVLERDGGPLAKMLPAFRMGLGGPLGNGRQWMSWIHREDLVAMILWLLDNERCKGVYNGTAPEPVTNAQFARELGRALGKPALLPMPGWVLKTMVGGMADLLLTGQKVLPQRAREEGFAFRYPELPGALAAILP